MPSRMLHEAICTSQKLASVSFEAEALYYRLQTKADDYGRFYADPTIVKNVCFAAGKKSQVHIDKTLKELNDAGLLVLYESEGEPYLYITKWEDKQTVRAKKSKFPDLPANANNCKQLQTNSHVIVNVNVNEDVIVNGDKGDRTTCREIVAAYHNICVSFPTLRTVSESRREKVRTRWQEHPTLEEWKEVFMKMEASDFLRGANDRKWKATFDWLVSNDTNMVKVLEGNYDNKEAGGGSQPYYKEL